MPEMFLTGFVRLPHTLNITLAMRTVKYLPLEELHQGNRALA